AERSAAANTLTVDERAVPREPVIDDHPLRCRPLQHGVPARDPWVALEVQIAVAAAADNHSVAARRERMGALAPGRVAPGEGRRLARHVAFTLRAPAMPDHQPQGVIGHTWANARSVELAQRHEPRLQGHPREPAALLDLGR